MYKNLIKTIFKAIALGLGIATIVLNSIGELSMTTSMSLFSIGLTALAIGTLLSKQYPNEY